MLTTDKHYRLLLEDMIRRDEKIGHMLEKLNAQYQFRDGIPKVELVVKMREDVTKEENDSVRYGLLQRINDKHVFIQDRFSIDALFEMMSAPTYAFAYFMSLMILTLAFFMMTVSFSQKMRESAWESGCLRAIGLTKVQNNRIFYYEATCIVTSSFIVGIAGGLMTTVLIAALWAQLTEMPRSTVIPFAPIGFMLLIISFATFLAVKLPTRKMNAKQISSVLRGIDN